MLHGGITRVVEFRRTRRIPIVLQRSRVSHLHTVTARCARTCCTRVPVGPAQLQHCLCDASRASAVALLVGGRGTGSMGCCPSKHTVQRPKTWPRRHRGSQHEAAEHPEHKAVSARVAALCGPAASTSRHGAVRRRATCTRRAGVVASQWLTRRGSWIVARPPFPSTPFMARCPRPKCHPAQALRTASTGGEGTSSAKAQTARCMWA